VVAVGALAGWLLLGRTNTPSSGTATTPGPAPVTPAASTRATAPHTSPQCDLRWDQTTGAPVPRSDCAGPRDTRGGRAKGFSHDQTGAVFAAINISVRLTSPVGPSVYRPTYAEQTVGDAQGALAEIASENSDAHVADTRPSQWWWRITAGNPAGDLVVVDLAAATPQTVVGNAFAHLSVTLQWVSGDWKVQLPRSRATVMSTVDGYTSLGVIPQAGS
jgi:hypothetical protein